MYGLSNSKTSVEPSLSQKVNKVDPVFQFLCSPPTRERQVTAISTLSTFDEKVEKLNHRRMFLYVLLLMNFSIYVFLYNFLFFTAQLTNTFTKNTFQLDYLMYISSEEGIQQLFVSPFALIVKMIIANPKQNEICNGTSKTNEMMFLQKELYLNWGLTF